MIFTEEAKAARIEFLIAFAYFMIFTEEAKAIRNSIRAVLRTMMV